jgi:hypothetical protein
MDGVAVVAVLALRAGVVLALYLFLFLVVRTLWAELSAAAAGPAADAAGGWLEVVACDGLPALAGKLYPLDAVTSIGRDPDNAVMIPDPRVSARHARLVRRGGAWWVEDLGSTNGTILNDTPVAGPARLGGGDMLQLGPATLRLRSA